MGVEHLLVRELEAEDIPSLLRYWYESDPDYLESLGVDLKKLPDRGDFEAMLTDQLARPYESKQAYCLIWEIAGKAEGHCNINHIRFGQSANMHLHLWSGRSRRRGFGSRLVRMSLPYFFRHMNLQTLYCEPYALNVAPNKVLAKAGFSFVREYVTVPGSINFEQPVRQWVMQREDLPA